MSMNSEDVRRFEGAVGQFSEDVRKLAQLIDYGYGGLLERLVTALEAQNNPTPTPAPEPVRECGTCGTTPCYPTTGDYLQSPCYRCMGVDGSRANWTPKSGCNDDTAHDRAIDAHMARAKEAKEEKGRQG